MVFCNRVLRLHSVLSFFLINLWLSQVNGHLPSTSRIRLFKRAVTPENPTGVEVVYDVRWFNSEEGKFGGCFGLKELQPSSPPTDFSLKFFFPQPDTNVTQYWGPFDLTHYHSGAYHLRPKEHGELQVCFNAYYNLNATGAGPNSTLPEAFALIKGKNYTDPVGSFSKEDVVIHPLKADLPTVPTGEFDRSKFVGQVGDEETRDAGLYSKNVTTTTSSNASSNSTTPIFIGAAAAGVVVIGIAAYMFVARKKPVKPSNASQSGNNSYGIIGTPSGVPAPPVILTEKLSEDEKPAFSEADEMQTTSPFVASPKLTTDGTDRQLSLLMHYAAMTDQRGDVDEDDLDSQRNSSQLNSIHANDKQINDYEAKLKELHSAVTREMEEKPASLQPQLSERPLSCVSGNEYFFAEEVLGDDVSRSPSAQHCIDHAYLESAIGYHQAQLEQCIQQEERRADVSVPMSPYLPSNLELDADMFLDHDGEYESYLEDEAFTAQFPTNNNPLPPLPESQDKNE